MLFCIRYKCFTCTITNSKTSLDEIEKILKKLVREDRLFIPGQTVREFAKNRPIKIQELYQQLSQKKSNLNKFQKGSYPLLEGIDSYDKLRKIEKELDDLVRDYKKKIDDIIELIREWNWDDPVSTMYNQVFRENSIVDLDLADAKKEEIIKELERRDFYKIPPGYKDSSKDDKGIGDYLIWETILKISNENKKDIIFVSGDQKADWRYGSENDKLFPRYELIDEFRRKTEGKTIHLIQLSTLLDLFDVNEEIINEIKTEESKSFSKKATVTIINSKDTVIKRLINAKKTLKVLLRKINKALNKYSNREVIGKIEKDQLSKIIDEIVRERPFASFENIFSNEEIERYSFENLESFYSYMKISLIN